MVYIGLDTTASEHFAFSIGGKKCVLRMGMFVQYFWLWLKFVGTVCQRVDLYLCSKWASSLRCCCLQWGVFWGPTVGNIAKNKASKC